MSGVGDGPINIEINEKISPQVVTGITAIADAARDADAAVLRLRAQIQGLDPAQVEALTAAVDAQAKAYLDQEAALNKAVISETKAQIAQVQLEAATTRLTKAQLSLTASQTAGATAGDRLLKSLEYQAATVGKTASEIAAYRAAQAGVTAEASPFIAKLAEAEKGLASYSLGTHRAATETVVLVREAARGNFSRMTSSGSILLQALTPLGLSLLAVAGAIGTVVLAALKGEEEFSKINNAIKATGDYAGITAGSYKVMQKSIADATGQGLGPANAALMTLVSSGKIGSDTLKTLATDSVNLANWTGESADKIATDFLKMTDGVTKYAVEFTSKYHLLDAAQIDYIRQLEAMGQKEEAEKALSQDVFTAIQQKGSEQLGILQRAVRATEDGFSHFWEYLKSIGRDATLQEQIASLKEELATPTTVIGSNSGNLSVVTRSKAETDAIKEQIAWRQNLLNVENAGAAMRANETRLNQEGIDASARLNGEWEKYAKNTNAADEAIKRFRADLKTALELNPNDHKALQDQANQAAVEARIRKSFDPVGTAEAKKAESYAQMRATTMSALTTKLADQLKVVDELNGKNKEQTDWDTIQVEMIKKKIVLTDAETKSIKDNLAQQAQGRRDNDANKIVKNIQDQTANLKLNSDERRIQQTLDKEQAAEIAKGNGPFSPAQLERMRQALIYQQRMAEFASVKDAPFNKAKSETDNIARQILEQHTYENNQAQMYARIDAMRQQDLLSEEQAAQAKALVDVQVQQERLANAQSFFGELANLQRSSNSTLAAIGKAAAIAQATIDGILAVQKALASAPPPWNFALAAAVGVVTTANIAQIAGVKFAGGGEVRGPGGPRDDRIPANLSNGEFVVNAASTSRYKDLLHAINDNRVSIPAYANGGLVPAPVPQGYGNVVKMPTSSAVIPKIVVENYGTPQTYQYKQISRDEVRMIAKDIVKSDAPIVISAQVSDHNSKVSRSLQRHTTVRPKRAGTS